MNCKFCDRPVYSHKPVPVCNMHYLRWKRYGRYDTPYKDKWYKPTKNRNGYMSIYNGYANKRILVHRLVMEKHLGRSLDPSEIVHHINGNKLDNRIENLQVLSHSEHMSSHKRGIDWSKYDIPKGRSRKDNPSRLYKEKTCLIDDCEKEAYCRGLCSNHYSSYWKIFESKH